jgi:predicted permease
VGQLLTESMVLAGAGGAAGLALAAGGRMLLSRNLPRNVDVMTEVLRFHVDAPVVICAVAAAAVTVITAGLLPAFRVTRVALTTVTRLGDRATAAGGGSRIERAGVIVQVALALLLVTTASLLTATLLKLSAVDPGLRAKDVYVSAIETRGTALEQAGIVPIHGDILARVRAIPGVEHAALATYVPFFGGRRATRDLELVAGTAGPLRDVVLDAVTPDFFASTGIAILAGRDIQASDAAGTEPVAVLAESVARRLGGGAELVGRHLRVAGQTSAVATIVGIARDARLNEIRREAPFVFYMPVTQTGAWPFLELTVRAPNAPPAFDRVLSRAVNDAAPSARVRFGSTLDAELRAALARERFAAVLASVFAVIALGLTAVGLYGLMTQQVARRRSELGVRVALGARGADLVALVARHSLWLVGMGVMLGVPLAVLAGRWIAPELYGVRAWEPSLFVASTLVLALTSAVALALPARRAAMTDPLTALKDT